MAAYYNEIDPYAAQWLRNLIAEGHIAPGDVDERDIRDVRPSDLLGYTQCHFFAGIGVWSAAARGAGWPDDRPLWTGSCPCQPFSAAGAGAGFDDERHLWPHWHHLIRVCRPPNVFGEQVASKDGLGWLDLVQADLEGENYACWPVDLCAAGIGAPHIRQRLWFTGVDELGNSAGARPQGFEDRRLDVLGSRGPATERTGGELTRSVAAVRLPDSDGRQCDGIADAEERESDRQTGGREQGDGSVAYDCSAGRLPDTASSGRGEERQDSGGRRPRDCEEGRPAGHSSSSVIRVADDDDDGRAPRAELQLLRPEYDAQHGRPARIVRPGPTNGIWGNADWLLCRDGKWRPVESGAQQMVDGSTQSLGRLRAADTRAVEKAVEQWAIRHQTDGTKAV